MGGRGERKPRENIKLFYSEQTMIIYNLSTAIEKVQSFDCFDNSYRKKGVAVTCFGRRRLRKTIRYTNNNKSN